MVAFAIITLKPLQISDMTEITKSATEAKTSKNPNEELKQKLN